ncbi:MAG: hypothetical protein UEP78_02935 [Negativibacillus sp.]|nr:hypothetical protein [Negativibacillus sp.]
MKQFCAVFLAFLLLSLSVCADSLNDPCTSNQSTTTRETYNLVSANPLFSMPGYADLADTSALAVQNPAQYGEIIYSVKQVDKLSVDLYRRNYASFAVKSPDGSFSYNRLPDKEDELLDLWIDEQTDLVYCIDDGNYYLLYYREESGEYCFAQQSEAAQSEGSYNENPDEGTSEEETPEEESPPFDDCYPQGELIPYGLRLLQSFDGVSFEELPVKRAETTLYDQDGAFLFDERFEAAPSTDCRYLKVQLKQFSRLPYLYADGVEGFTDVNLPHLSMIRQVRCSGPVQPLNPDDGADLPLGEEETDEEEAKEKTEKKTVSSAKKSSDSTKSSSGGDSRVETTTSTSTSTSSSTTDSNNSTTTYTTNYIFIGSSPESAAALCDILGIEPNDLENLQAILGSTSSVLPNSSDSGEEKAAVASVLYQQPVIGLSQQEEDSASPFDSEEDNDLILYLCITAVAVAAFCVIALLVRKSLAAKKEKTDTDSQEDDFDNL